MKATSLGLIGLVAGAALLCLATAARSQEPPAPPTDAEAFPTVTVTEEMRSHQRWLDGLYFGGTAYGLLVLAAVLGLGVSRRLRDVAARVTARPFPSAMIYAALLALVTTIASLPMDWLGGFFVPHRFDLSNQTLPAWLWDQTKGLLLGIAIGAPLAALALAGIRRLRRWWLALWLGSVPLAIALILVAPVVLDPVFNEFKPLADAELREDILTLASQAGIAGGRVYEVDKSKQTKTMNAYVNGLGPTKRIVLWDTIIAKLDRQELRFVMAHEMGHYVRHHIWKMLGALLAVLLLVFWAGQRIVEEAIARWGRGWGVTAAHDPAALPLLLLVLSAAMFLLTPAINGVSRAFERESDTFALELTRANHAGARAFVKLAEDSKVLPDPHPFVRFWRYSHPSLAERIGFCRTYRPWAEGAPNRVWQGAAATAVLPPAGT